MKHAMKKIMGLLLVVVLLVSVVPFQALAAEISGGNDYKGFDQIVITVNDEVKVNTPWVEAGGKGPESKTVRDILNNFFPEWSNGDYGFKSAMYAGQAAELDTTLRTNFDDTSVAIALYTTPVYTVTVKYFVDGTNEQRGDAVTFQRKDGAALTFNDVAGAAPEKDAYKVVRVTSSNAQVSINSGESYAVKSDMEFFAYLKGTGSSSGGSNNGGSTTSMLTAQYYVDGVLRTESYNVDGKTVSELLAMADYKADNYNISAQVGNASKGMNDVIYRGETVAITMTTKNTKFLTAQYYVDGKLRTENYDVDGKTVSELVSDSKLGNYNADNYNITAKVGSTTKGMKDVIYRGETVAITMNTKGSSSTTKVLTAHYYVDGDYEKTKEFDVDGKRISELLSMADYKASNYSKITSTVNGTDKGTDDVVVYRDQTVKIYMTAKSSNKFPYKVYLHVYLNNNIGEPDRNINITNTLATDGVVSMSEVKNLIPDYYKAKNSNGIGYDGLYLAKGNWVKDYVTDSSKYEKLNDVDVRSGDEYVHINVMITNAKAKNSSTADTSNPKTGDAIFMTITVMGLSAAALTGLYFYDKKRKAL